MSATPLNRIHIIFNGEKSRRKVDEYCEQVRLQIPKCEIAITVTHDLHQGLRNCATIFYRI